jgi:hypothetical protein
MKLTSRSCQLDYFDPEKFECLKNSRALFNKIMARHLLGNMVTLFVDYGVVNLDCLYEISRMNLDDARRFLHDSRQINSGNLPVAKCFLQCTDDTMVEQIFEHAQKLARNYVNDCTHLSKEEI